MKKSGEIVSSASLTRAPYPPLARSPFPNGEGCDTRAPLSPKQSLPRVGKVASGASRIGFWRHEKQVGKIVSSASFTRAPEHCPKRKPTPPRCARQPLPREGARVDTPSFLPMEGGAPKGRRLDGGSGMKKSGEIISGRRFMKAPSAKTAYKTYL